MRTTLLINGDDKAAQSWSAALEADGYSVVVAKDGLEGLCNFGLHAPDLIVADKDSLAERWNDIPVLSWVQSMYENTPILALTDWTPEEDGSFFVRGQHVYRAPNPDWPSQLSQFADLVLILSDISYKHPCPQAN